MNLKILHIEDKCTGCGACVSICPKNCLQLSSDKEGFYFPEYNPTNCIECGLCEKTCHAIGEKYTEPLPRDNFYLYHTNDAALHEASTSGGIFSVLAEYVLSKNGVVFGSYYDGNKGIVKVGCSEDVDWHRFRKSKYIESYTGAVFKNVLQYLQAGRLVLYAGTPCQIYGLKAFIAAKHKSPDNLITMDFACHGVPCIKLFSEFKSRYENSRRRVENADFRYKDFKDPFLGWHSMTLAMTFNEGKKMVIHNANKDFYFYYQPFLDDLDLRKCCYRCDRASHSKADITVGDFWGIYKYRKELDTNRGMAFISINNPGLINLWEKLAVDSGFLEKLPYEHIAYQFSEMNPDRTRFLKMRNDFMSDVEKLGLHKTVIKHYGKKRVYVDTMILNLKIKVKKLIKRY